MIRGSYNLCSLWGLLCKDSFSPIHRAPAWNVRLKIAKVRFRVYQVHSRPETPNLNRTPKLQPHAIYPCNPTSYNLEGPSDIVSS